MRGKAGVRQIANPMTHGNLFRLRSVILDGFLNNEACNEFSVPEKCFREMFPIAFAAAATADSF